MCLALLHEGYQLPNSIHPPFLAQISINQPITCRY